MKKLRLGALGIGRRARSLLTLYAKHEAVEIVGLCDLYDKNLELAKGTQYLHNPSLATYHDFDDMLRLCPMDALFIALPPDIQADFACRAMEHGIHVLTEVPCTYTIEDCWRLVDTAEKTGMVYMLAEQLRYGHYLNEWRKLNLDGTLGKILFVEGQYLHYEHWGYFIDTTTGDILANKDTLEPAPHIEYTSDKPAEQRVFAPHWRYETFRHPIYYLPHELSPLLRVMNDRVTEVVCMGSQKGINALDGGMPFNPENRDVEVALMKTEKDAVLRMMVCFSTHCPSSHWHHVMGSKGSVETARIFSYSDYKEDAPKLWTLEGGWQKRPDWTLSPPAADDIAKQSGHGGVDWYPIDNFVNTILNGAPNTMDVYRAVETAAPAILAAQSCELGGQKLTVPDFRAKYNRPIDRAFAL